MTSSPALLGWTECKSRREIQVTQSGKFTRKKQGDRVSVGRDEKILEMVMAAWSCEQTGRPWIVHLKRTKWKFCVMHIFPPKSFDCVDHNQLWKILKEMGISEHLTCLLRNLYESQKAKIITGHRTMDWFKTEKGVVKAVYCHPAYLTYIQSTSLDTLDWKKQKLESRLLGEITITSNMQSTPP